MLNVPPIMRPFEDFLGFNVEDFLMRLDLSCTS